MVAFTRPQTLKIFWKNIRPSTGWALLAALGASPIYSLKLKKF